MTASNIGNYYELEAIDVFGDEYWLEICEAFYDLYELDLPPHIAEKLIERERQLKEKPDYDQYEAYLTDYYSAYLEEYEMKQQACGE